MRKTASFFDRINKKLVGGVLCIAAAVLIFFLPGEFLHKIVKAAGAVIIAVSAIRFIRLAGRKIGSPIPFMGILNAVLLFALGTVLLYTPDGAMRFMFSSIGLYLIVTAVLQGAKLLIVPKGTREALWRVEASFAAVVLVLGVWLTLSPCGAGRLTEIIAGVSLAVKGVELILGALRDAGPAIKKRKVHENGDIEANFVDRSDEL